MTTQSSTLGIVAVALGLAAAYVLIGNSSDVVQLDDGTTELNQDPNAWTFDVLDPINYLTDQAMVNETTAGLNRQAFLQMLRRCEGTTGPDGYQALFGYPAAGRVFTSFADHPRHAFSFTDQKGQKLWTTAAGAYQIMAKSPLPTGGATKVDTWGDAVRALNLPDFSPASQDAAALWLIDGAGALADVDAGRLSKAVTKCRRIWASLPGAGYAQPTRTMTQVQQWFAQAGGLQTEA